LTTLHSTGTTTATATKCLAVIIIILILIIIIIIIKNEKIRVTLCENAAWALYIVNRMCVDVQHVQG